MLMSDIEKLKTAIKGAVAVGVADLFIELDLLPLGSALRQELAQREQGLTRALTDGVLRALKVSLEIEVLDMSIEGALKAANLISAELEAQAQTPAKF
jgi:hypothetical protein